jgi:integrase
VASRKRHRAPGTYRTRRNTQCWPSSPHTAQAAAFAIYTGLRAGEQLALTWDMVDLRKAEILIPAALAKGHRDRRVVMLEPAVEVLRRIPRHIRSSHVFRHSDGTPLTTFWRGLVGAARRAGVKDLTWHDLRRTHGCRLLQDWGWSLEMVRDQLGHASVAQTERAYAFLEVDQRHAAAQKPAQAKRISSNV